MRQEEIMKIINESLQILKT
jgi:hypothetical protein